MSSGDPPVGEARDRASLAKFRTSLSLDRTTLAWIRTALTMASFGFGMVAFFRSVRETSPTSEAARLHQGAIRFGVGLIMLGVVATVLASLSHCLTLRRLHLGQQPVLRQWPMSVMVAFLLGVLCFVGLWEVLVR
jgi:putative membrane protein